MNIPKIQLNILILIFNVLYLILSFQYVSILANPVVSPQSPPPPPFDEERLPPSSKANSTIFANTGGHSINNVSNITQNLFQSSISCGHSEFYVQITFNKPFKGLLYAYKNFQPDNLTPGHYYPIQILDTCTLRGNGASVVYLELSFLSECVEKLAPYVPPEISGTSMGTQMNEDTAEVVNDTLLNSYTSPPSENPSATTPTQSQHHKINLDGFNFRRALNGNGHQANISREDNYQLSLYIQNDPNIEQKTDSKVTIQCSSEITKNIIFEQNLSNDYSRKMDPNNHHQMATSKNQTIVPKVKLTVVGDSQNENLTRVTNSIETRIDILRGRIPFLKIIENSIELGDDVTLIIRAKEIDDYDSRMSTCYAYQDETDVEDGQSIRYELTNEQGCSRDPSVMAPFKVMRNVGSESKVFYTTFAAFRFPTTTQMNIHCTLVVCSNSCSKVSCEK